MCHVNSIVVFLMSGILPVMENRPEALVDSDPSQISIKFDQGNDCASLVGCNSLFFF